MNASALFLTAALSVSQPPGGADLPPPTPITLPTAPVPPPAVAPRPISLEEFASTFKPLPGTYEITFIHPRKKCPVNVTFTLPADCGCPRMRVTKHEIEFDYGKHQVEIRFRLFGKVSVITD